MDIQVILTNVKETMKQWFALKSEVPTKTSDLVNDSNFVMQSEVRNNLTSTDVNLPLSAKQGKELNEKVTAITENNSKSQSGFDGMGGFFSKVVKNGWCMISTINSNFPNISSWQYTTTLTPKAGVMLNPTLLGFFYDRAADNTPVGYIEAYPNGDIRFRSFETLPLSRFEYVTFTIIYPIQE